MKRFKEKSEVSLHLIKVWKYLKENSEKWSTNHQIAEFVKFSERTVRMHTLYLVRSGLVDQMEVFPGHRYKMANNPDKRNVNFYDRLEKVSEIFDM